MSAFNLANARVTGDQQGAIPVGIGATGVDPLEQPFPAAEIPALVVEKWTKVELGETVVPPSIAGRLAAEMGLDGIKQPPEAQLVPVG